MTAMPQPPMKWHNFLVKFGLLLGVISNIALAALVISGKQYEVQGLNAAYVYRYFPGLQAADIVYGVALLLCAVYSWQTRTALKNLRTSAPSMVQAMYLMSLISTILYTVVTILLTHVDLEFSSLASTIASSVVGMLLHKTYYGKRSYMFIN